MSESPTVSVQWIDQHMLSAHQLSHPNWQEIYARIETDFKHLDQAQLWPAIAQHWLAKLTDDLGNGYVTTETENFVLLSNANDRYNATLAQFMETCFRRIMRFLNGITDDSGFGKHIVMVFDSNDTYYDYVSFYGPQEGTYGLSSGMYLNYGYGHFVFPHQDHDVAEPIVAHEMTHALLSHLPIPAWLNEGLAVNMEAVVTGFSSGGLTKETFAQHQKFWGPYEIQEFWIGHSFSRPDEGQKLSYQLAEILVQSLSQQHDHFPAYCNKASWEDAGESALQEIFDLSLGDMIENFIGPGEWRPDPDSWPAVTNNIE